METELDNKYCRICMLECIDEMDIFHDIFDSVNDKYCTFSESISFCTGLKIYKGDGLPTIICEPCINDLRIAHRFKDIAVQTDRRLRTPKQRHILHSYLPPEDEVKEECIESDDGVTESIGHVEVKMEEYRSPKRVRRKRKGVKRKYYRCMMCNINFGTPEEYRKHKMKFHPDPIIVSSICEVCGKYIPRGYKRHLLSHQEPIILYCAHCQYRTANKYLLATHMGIHFKTRTFQCEYCSASPTSLANLRAHIKRNHTKVRDYKCGQCERAFCYKNELQQHMDVHMGIKRYHCNKCDKMYADLQDLKKHLLKIHEITTLKSKSGPKVSNEIIGADKSGQIHLVAKKII